MVVNNNGGRIWKEVMLASGTKEYQDWNLGPSE
jgi:hypothetical protein